MSDILNEQLSALLDGELPAEQTTLLLRRLEREPELRARLARYRLGGDVLRGERIQPRPDFALRVSDRVAAEPVLAAPRPARARRRVPGWLRSATGLAVAATVAAVSVLLLQQHEAAAPLAVARVELPAAPFRATPALPASGAEPASYVTPAQRPSLGSIPQGQLANYVVAHSEVSSPLGRSSVLTSLVTEEPAQEAASR